MLVENCPLCVTDGGALIWSGEKLRVIRAAEEGFPAFYRVVWNDHAAEFSDLSATDRIVCMDAVALVERVLREQLAPTKINLAALGNMVAHLHWHVIARYDWDSHFPASVWAAAQRERDQEREAEIARQLPQVDEVLQKALALWAA
ncbi:DeoR faimly transcriptional regulator [Comamonas testosteroni]|uniref:DeoR faimly transcriptional regulator n=1 Tax=Comamonas testosteroni TaxID=285 RepID=A0A0L7MEV0_COMTE|nr:HIT family protein [Comamonas testosteroni]KOC20424.1 DeoR faimly transcriptional regulator [Comamonas testosteroni]KWT73377.1 Diadenosine tetraphosphate (Ap4A) hydrolase [Comamonas testosteroni]